MLLGYVFHVFAGDGAYESQESFERFDSRIRDIIARVRSVYSGAIMVSGSQSVYDFPEAADFVGVTTYDLGRPDLPYDASVDDWRAAYDALFTTDLDWKWERWSRPVFFYTIHAPPFPDDPDPAGELAQARQLEGFFQALETRPWVMGAFSWSYQMVRAPLHDGDGIRGRLAEAVLAKYYGRYVGLN